MSLCGPMKKIPGFTSYSSIVISVRCLCLMYYRSLKFNALDGKVDRKSHNGEYSVVGGVPR